MLRAPHNHITRLRLKYIKYHRSHGTATSTDTADVHRGSFPPPGALRPSCPVGFIAPKAAGQGKGRSPRRGPGRNLAPSAFRQPGARWFVLFLSRNISCRQQKQFLFPSQRSAAFGAANLQPAFHPGAGSGAAWPGQGWGRMGRRGCAPNGQRAAPATAV